MMKTTIKEKIYERQRTHRTVFKSYTVLEDHRCAGKLQYASDTYMGILPKGRKSSMP